jgi:hypothetical protein
MKESRRTYNPSLSLPFQMIEFIFEAYLNHIRGGSRLVRTHKQK